MEAIKQSIREAVLAEYQKASEKFGATHNSAHEAYAVILEEFKEAKCEFRQLKFELERFWGETVANEPTREEAECIMESAILAAAELVQVAAMAYKATLPYGCEQKEEAEKCIR